ncbi:MAG TPA: SDR family oxidoreductase [Candidatus Saccharimonadales bacterium]|nr:SDR family oxidoreductase [Candidatus Saccharimonadales bacterium]
MIVIVGGSGRLGQELVKLFKKDGKVVASIARRQNEEADHNISCDLSDGGEVESAAHEVEALDEPLEAIINAAGFYHSAPLGKLTNEEAQLNFAIHVKAPMLLVSNLIGRIKNDGTDIVNISSIATVNGATDAPAYGASKWALRGFSGDLRKVFKDYPSRVISLCPAAFDTEDENQMDTREVAALIKHVIGLPKNMEVSEIILDHKNNR